MFILALAAAASCIAIDGDTLRCGRERVRLIGIDAPEMPGHCRRGRVCVTGDPFASRAALRRAMQSGPIRFDRRGHDVYGRTLAIVYAGRTNLSCSQIAQRQAIFKPHWDSGGVIGRECY